MILWKISVESDDFELCRALKEKKKKRNPTEVFEVLEPDTLWAEWLGIQFRKTVRSGKHIFFLFRPSEVLQMSLLSRGKTRRL